MFAACAVMAYVVRLYLIRKNKQLDAAEALLAQAQSGVDDALVEKTARTQGMTLEEAATLKASYRFYVSVPLPRSPLTQGLITVLHRSERHRRHQFNQNCSYG